MTIAERFFGKRLSIFKEVFLWLIVCVVGVVVVLIVAVVVVVSVPCSAVVAAFGCEVKDACSVRVHSFVTGLAVSTRRPFFPMRRSRPLTLGRIFCFQASHSPVGNACRVVLTSGVSGPIG